MIWDRFLISASLLASGLTAGCVAEGPQPVEDLTRARTLVAQAEKGNAQQYATADLQRARDELGDAEKANADHHYDEARRYAQSAAVDADVAAARGAAEDAQRAAREAVKGNATLRDEAARGLEMSADRPNPQ
jgi:hypothetical protein